MPGGREETEPGPGVSRLLGVLLHLLSRHGAALARPANTPAGTAFSEENTNQDLLIARKQQWGNLSDSAREQFYWTTPGIEYTEVDDDSKIPKGGRDVETNKVLPPPSNFLLLLLYPMEVKYLCLRDNYSQFDQLVVVKKEDVEENDGNLKSEQGDGVLENEKKEVEGRET